MVGVYDSIKPKGYCGQPYDYGQKDSIFISCVYYCDYLGNRKVSLLHYRPGSSQDPALGPVKTACPSCRRQWFAHTFMKNPDYELRR